MTSFREGRVARALLSKRFPTQRCSAAKPFAAAKAHPTQLVIAEQRPFSLMQRHAHLRPASAAPLA